jgi:hypothetical protein
MATKACKDCGAGSKRPAPYSGPRCATHHRERKKALKRAAHARWIEKTYGITSEQYWALYEAQGGCCIICQRAKGVKKLLAVDHDHATGYVRGLLCGPCNQILGHLRDDQAAAWRVWKYLDSPPAFDVIGWVKPDE